MPLALIDRTARSKQLVPPVQETDLDRILKLVPTEVLAFYTAAVPITPHVPWTYFPLTLFLTGVALVPLVLFLDGRTMNAPARWPQYVVRTLAFIAWALAISWPFAPWLPKDSIGWVSSLAVLIIPLIGGLVLRDKPPAAPQG
jgi:hypothetical protein